MQKHILFFNVAQQKKLQTLKTAKDMGLKVSVIGLELPDWAQPFVDNFILSDTNNIEEMIRTLKVKHLTDPFHGVVTFWDRDVEPVAHAANALGLFGSPISGAEKARNKYYMRKRLEELGIPHPKFQHVSTWTQMENAALSLGYPLIFKPVGAASSKGVFKIHNEEELHNAFNTMMEVATPENDIMFGFYKNQYLLEEYMNGSEVSVEGIVAKSEIYIVGVTEKWTTNNFTEHQHAFPARLQESVKEEVYKITRDSVKALEIDNCGFHAEIMITPNGCKVVEINSRLGGGCITTHLVPFSSGVNIIQANLQAVLGENITTDWEEKRGTCVKYLVAEEEGIVQSWEGIDDIEAIPGVIEFVIEKQIKETVTLPPTKYGDNRLCYVITTGDSTDEAIEIAQNAMAGVRCKISEN